MLRVNSNTASNREANFHQKLPKTVRIGFKVTDSLGIYVCIIKPMGPCTYKEYVYEILSRTSFHIVGTSSRTHYYTNALRQSIIYLPSM